MPQIIYRVMQMKDGRWSHGAALNYPSRQDAELIAWSLVKGGAAEAADVVEIRTDGGEIICRIRRGPDGRTFKK